MDTIFDWLIRHGIIVEDKKLIDEAFTHSSYVNEHKQAKHDNERLEFMGDAVMQIWVSERLFDLVPPLSEGRMSTARSQLVCEKSFADLMRTMELYPYLKLGVGEEKNGGRNRNSILADCFEAFVGALYLSCGMDAVDKVLEPYLMPLIENVQNAEVTDYKSKLQEYAQADVRKSVSYVLESESGPANNPEFEMGVYLDGILLGKGKGKSKKDAEQMAAKEALKILVK